MDEKLAHLTMVQIEELIERYYYKGEKVKNLIQEYNIETIPSQLVKLFPPVVTDEICIHCNVNLIMYHLSRDNSWDDKYPSCPSCGHHDLPPFCGCRNCQEQEQLRVRNEREEKQELLDSLLHINDDEKIDLENLYLEVRTYLGAFLREGISEDFNYIKPIENFINPLAPTQDFTNNILELLRVKRLIVIHPDSDPDHFMDIDIENGSFTFDPSKVKWALNVKKEGFNKVPIVESLINPSEKIDSEVAYKIWRKISLHEALEYFYYSVNTILGVEYSPGEKTTSVLNDLINDYSVSQIYTIMYRATNNALRYQVEHGVSRRQAANTIIGNAQSFAERAKVNGWNIQKYSRRKDLPESALSKFFFERILIGGAGFYDKPRLIELNEE